jgi:hypothetical protein
LLKFRPIRRRYSARSFYAKLSLLPPVATKENAPPFSRRETMWGVYARIFAASLPRE